MLKRLYKKLIQEWSKLSRKRQVFYITLLSILLLVIIVPSSAKAKLGSAIASVLGWVIAQFLTWLSKVLTLEISIFSKFAQFNNFLGVTAVQEGWRLVRDVCNMFFIVILLVISFATILKIESYAYKKWLGKLVLAAILINFSKTITGILIGFSQVAMLTFVSAFKDAVAGNLGAGLHLNEMMSASVRGATNNDNLDSVAVFGALLLAFVLLTVFAVVMLIMIVVLVGRIVSLWVLVILSPVAFLLQASPFGAKYAKQWWQELGKNLVAGPVLAFFLWLAFLTVQRSSGNVAESMEKGLTQNETGTTFEGEPEFMTGISSTSALMDYIITIALLLAAIKMTQEMGVIGSSFAGKMQQNLGKWGKKAALGTASYLDRKQAMTTGKSIQEVYKNLKGAMADKTNEDWDRVREKAGQNAKEGATGVGRIVSSLTAGKEAHKTFLLNGFLNAKGFKEMGMIASKQKGFYTKKEQEDKLRDEVGGKITEANNKMQNIAILESPEVKLAIMVKAAEKASKAQEEQKKIEESLLGVGRGNKEKELKEKLLIEQQNESEANEEFKRAQDAFVKGEATPEQKNKRLDVDGTTMTSEGDQWIQDRKKEERKKFKKENKSRRDKKIEELEESEEYENASSEEKENMMRKVKYEYNNKRAIGLAHIEDNYKLVRDGGASENPLKAGKTLALNNIEENRQKELKNVVNPLKKGKINKKYNQQLEELEKDEQYQYANNDSYDKFIKHTRQDLDSAVDMGMQEGWISQDQGGKLKNNFKNFESDAQKLGGIDIDKMLLDLSKINTKDQEKYKIEQEINNINTLNNDLEEFGAVYTDSDSITKEIKELKEIIRLKGKDSKEGKKAQNGIDALEKDRELWKNLKDRKIEIENTIKAKIKAEEKADVKEFQGKYLNKALGVLSKGKKSIEDQVNKYSPPESLSARSATRELINNEKKKFADIDDASELSAHLRSAIKRGEKYQTRAIMEKMAADANDNEFLNDLGFTSNGIGMEQFRRDILKGKLKMGEQESLQVLNDVGYINEKVNHWETARLVSTTATGQMKSKIVQKSDGSWDDTAHAIEAFTEVSKMNSRNLMNNLNRLAYGGEKVRSDGSGRDFEFSNLGKMIITMLNGDKELMSKRGSEMNINASQNFMSPSAKEELARLVGDDSLLFETVSKVSGETSGMRANYEVIVNLLRNQGHWRG